MAGPEPDAPLTQATQLAFPGGLAGAAVRHRRDAGRAPRDRLQRERVDSGVGPNQLRDGPGQESSPTGSTRFTRTTRRRTARSWSRGFIIVFSRPRSRHQGAGEGGERPPPHRLRASERGAHRLSGDGPGVRPGVHRAAVPGYAALGAALSLGLVAFMEPLSQAVGAVVALAALAWYFVYAPETRKKAMTPTTPDAGTAPGRPARTRPTRSRRTELADRRTWSPRTHDRERADDPRRRAGELEDGRVLATHVAGPGPDLAGGRRRRTRPHRRTSESLWPRAKPMPRRSMCRSRRRRFCRRGSLRAVRVSTPRTTPTLVVMGFEHDRICGRACRTDDERVDESPAL